MSGSKYVAVNLASALERCSGDTELLSQAIHDYFYMHIALNIVHGASQIL
jgi:hypothetical protein